MPEISLTEFVDYSIKTGTTKLTEVRKIKRRHGEDYNPAFDFYKRLREGIIEHHEQGYSKKHLDELMKGLTDKKKQNTYPGLINAYKKFLGRKDIDWFTPKRAKWASGKLSVRINPELGLKINGKKCYVKLYFKEDKLTKQRIEMISHMMIETLSSGSSKGINVALLDIRNSKLHTFTAMSEDLALVLESEALSFCQMYRGA